VGRVHAELHRLDVPGLPVADDKARVDALARNCDWIGFFRPNDALRLARVRDRLLQIADRFDKTALVTCHGDLVPSHVLHGADGWAVVDFDLTHRGDAHADSALLLASLTQDVPMLRRTWRDPKSEPLGLLNRAVAAYVEGYQSFGGPVLDRRRLLWHRIATEVHMLGLMFTKDRFDPLAFERSMGLIEGLATDLGGPREGAA
jgi:aminoglycoside phosphotransferase (APT) family kinase protein